VDPERSTEGASGWIVARRSRYSPAARWLLPDAAMLVSCVALFHGLFFGEGPSKLFRDSDTGWHIRNGESILSRHTLPTTDPFSFTKSGQAWVAWEWGADVIMGAAHRWDGLRGVAMLYALVASLAVWLWFRLHWTVGGNFFLACAMASMMLSTLSLHWLARPHLFGWVFSIGAVLAMEKAAPKFRVTAAAGFFTAGMLWANIHASFFLLPAIALLYALCAAIHPLLWDEKTNPWWYVWASVFALAGTFVNPYGWALHFHVIAYLTDRELLARIGEFQSFNFHAEGAGQILMTVLLALIGVPSMLNSRRGKPRLEHAILVLGLVSMSLRSARGLPLVALLALPLVNGAITKTMWQAGVGRRLRKILDRYLSYSFRVEQLDRGCGGYAWAPAMIALAFVILHAPAVAAQTGFPAKEFPVDAAQAVAALPRDARILAPDKYGGYLIYRFRGERKVYFDGRSDFYGVDFMKDYVRLMEARPGWREQVLRHRFDYALLPNNYTLVDGLQHWGWQVVHRDSTATLLRK